MFFEFVDVWLQLPLLPIEQSLKLAYFLRDLNVERWFLVALVIGVLRHPVANDVLMLGMVSCQLRDLVDQYLRMVDYFLGVRGFVQSDQEVLLHRIAQLLLQLLST